MSNLFSSSERWVVIYSISSDDIEDYMQFMGNALMERLGHMRHWKHTGYIEERFEEWGLVNVIYPVKEFGKSLTNF